MSRCFSICLQTTVVLFMCAQGLAAQTVPARPLLLGPVSLSPSIALRDVGVDSNIRGEWERPREDFTLTAQPRLRAAMSLGSALVSGGATVGFVYYATYKGEQSINRLFEGRIEGTSGRLRPFLAAGFNQARERAGYEIHARTDHQELTLAAGAELELTGITSLTGFYRHTPQKYGDDERFLGVALAAQLDHTTEVANVGAKVAITPFTTVSVDVELQRDRFDTSGFRDADSVRVMPGVAFAPDAVLSGRIAAGFRRFTPREPRAADFQGLVVSATATSTVFSSTRLGLDVFRDVGYSFEPVTPHFLVDSAHLTVAQGIVRPFEIVAVAGFDQLRYFGLQGEASGRAERTRKVGGGVGLRLSPSLRFTLIYDVIERTSSQRELRTYQQRRLFASATYGV